MCAWRWPTWSKASDAVAALRAGASGQVNIGTILTASTTLVPQALVRTKAIAPGLCMQVQVDTSDQLLRRLSMGQLDFLIARLQSQDDEADMAYEDLSDETECAVARPAASAAGMRPDLTLADLATCGWILSPRGSILRHRFDMMFRRARLEPPANVVETTVLTLVTSLLQQTDFLHVMPLDVARSYVAVGSDGPAADRRCPARWTASASSRGATSCCRLALPCCSSRCARWPRRSMPVRPARRALTPVGGAQRTSVLSWMIGSITASTISITTRPMATISSGSRMVASCIARRCTSAPSCAATRCSISGSWPVCSPRRANIGQHRRETLVPAQRRRNRRAFAHQHQRGQRIGAHGAVVQRLGR